MVAILFATALYARGQVRQAVELRRDQSRPYVVPSIEVEQQFMFMLTLENVGRTPARNIEIAFDQPPRSTLKDIEAVRFVREPIPTMPPGQKFRAYWESALALALAVFSDENPYPHPVSYRVRVSYHDHQGHHFGPEDYVLDFRVFEGQAAGLKGITELIRTMEDLLKEQKKWTDGSRGLRVNVRSADTMDRREARPIHFRGARPEYREHGSLAAIRYWVDVWRRRYGLWSS